MKVFITKQFGRTAFYIVTHEGVVYVSRTPSLTGDNFMTSKLSVKTIMKMCASGAMAPFNSQAANMVRDYYKKERNKNIGIFLIAMSVAVGSILLGVWA